MITFLFALFLSVNVHALTNSTAAISPDFESNIMIVTYGPDGQGGSAPGFCNASLVTNQVMITAAHCLKDAFALKDRNIRVHVGAYKYVVNPSGQTVRVGYADYLIVQAKGDFFFTPEVEELILKKGVKAKIDPSDDTAVVILSNPLLLKPDFKYAEVVPKSWIGQVTKDLLRFNPTVVTVNPIEEVTTTDTKKMAGLNKLVDKGGYLTSQSTSRVKSGDSGAPLYVNISGTWKIFANVKGEVRRLMVSEDLYTRSTNNLCAISHVIGSTGLEKLLCP